MNPQIFGVLMDRLLAEGALDVFYTSIQMKKNRPGTLLTLIAPPGCARAPHGDVFRETTTIGVRYREMTRECLDRETVTVRHAAWRRPLQGGAAQRRGAQRVARVRRLRAHRRASAACRSRTSRRPR